MKLKRLFSGLLAAALAAGLTVLPPAAPAAPPSTPAAP